MFISNPYMSSSLPSFVEDNANYGSQMLDGMGPKGAKKKREANHNRQREEKGGGVKAHRDREPAGKSSDNNSDDKEDYGALKARLFDTLQEEVTALDVLKKQIQQFAVITQNAEKYCNMDLMNAALARQGLQSVVPPQFMPGQRPPNRPQLVRPVGRQMLPPMMRQPPPQRFRQPVPPPAHMRNLPRPQPRYPNQQLLVQENPMDAAFKTLRDVENRLKHAEKTVAHKIELYEKHVKKKTGNVGLREKEKQQPPGKMESIKNMAVKTLHDIERRLKVTEKNMDAAAMRKNKDQNMFVFNEFSFSKSL